MEPGDRRETWETKLALRTKVKKNTEKYILRRQEAIAAFRQTSYAEVLKKAINAEQRRTQAEGERQQKEGTVTKWEKYRKVSNIKGGVGQTVRQDNTREKDNEGWTTVTRKKSSKQDKTQGEKRLAQKKEELMAQGKCFNCLEKGHRRYQCRGMIKCLKCELMGHKAAECREKGQGGIKERVKADTNLRRAIKEVAGQIEGVNTEEQVQTQNLINQQTELQGHTTIPNAPSAPSRTQNSAQTQQKPEMEMLYNWETMPLNGAAYVEEGRATDMTVFLPKRNTASTTTAFLNRSAIVLTGPNYNDSQLVRRLTNKLAYQFSRPPQHFQVGKLPASTGDLIAIFSSRNMMQQAVSIGAFALGPGVQVQLREYNLYGGMAHDPTTYKARLKIHDLPLEYWTWEDVSQLVLGFSNLEKMAPVFSNGNFSELRILVGCYHPTKIPTYITVTEDPYTITCQIEIEGWLHNDSLRTATVHAGAERSDENHPDEGQDEGKYWEKEWKKTLRNKLSSSFDSRECSGPVTQYNRRESTYGGVRGYRALLERMLPQQNGEQGGINWKGKTVCITVLNSPGLLKVHITQGNSIYEVQIVESWGTRSMSVLTAQVERTLLTEWVSNGLERKGSEERYRSRQQKVIKSTAGYKGVREGNLGENQLHKNQGEKEGGKKQETWAQINQALRDKQADSEETRELVQQGSSTEERANGPAIGLLEHTTMEPLDGPPPGFEGPQLSRSPARRSARISQKYKGAYISPKEKARINTKPNTLQWPKEKTRQRRNTCQVQAQLDYFKTHDPLTESQAEVLLMAAGIESHGAVSERVRAVLNH